MYDNQFVSAGGAIWSTVAYSFESPLKTLLESPKGFTLEELLDQDELLQELRSMHPQLVRFFSQEHVVAHLIQFLLVDPMGMTHTNSHKDPGTEDSDRKDSSDERGSPMHMDSAETAHPNHETDHAKHWIYSHTIEPLSSSPTLDNADIELRSHGAVEAHEQARSEIISWDKLYIRYPYMACEIICCEIPDVLDILVTGNLHNMGTTTFSFQRSLLPHPSSILDLLFTMLDSSSNSSSLEAGNDGDMDSTNNHTLHMLDDRRAGYLDKILSLLFRERPTYMAAYLNGDHLGMQPNASDQVNTLHSGGGIPLVHCFFRHLHSHSIMQILQRLLIPPLVSQIACTTGTEEDPEGNTSASDSTTTTTTSTASASLMGISQKIMQEAYSEDVNGGDGEIVTDTENCMGWFPCKWLEWDLVIQLLIDRLLGVSETTLAVEVIEDEDVLIQASYHTCDILVNIIQRSPLTSTILKKLTTDPYLGKIIGSACGLMNFHFPPGHDTFRLDPSYLPAHFSRHDSIMTTSMSVLESLVLQLGGYGAVTTPEEAYTIAELAKDPMNQLHGKSNDFANINALMIHLPFLLQSLSYLLVHPDTEHWTTYTQYSDSPQNILGMSRLRIVRLIESLVLIGRKEIDQLLNRSNCLEECLNLMWKFPWCSMLHQSVANLLVHVFEGEEDRTILQKYFIYRCDLLRRLMDAIVFSDIPLVKYMPSQSMQAQISELGGTVLDNEPSKLDATNSTTELSAVHVGMDGVSSFDIENDSEIPVSDDDIDSAMEQEDTILSSGNIVDDKSTPNFDTTSHGSIDCECRDTLCVSLKEKRDVSEQGRGKSWPHDESSSIQRLGYVGHVLIICQALIQGCNHELNNATQPDAHISYGEEIDGKLFSSSKNSPFDDFDDSPRKKIRPMDMESDNMILQDEQLSLRLMMENHPLYEQWLIFIENQLASELTIQGTALGGLNSQAITTVVEESGNDLNFVPCDYSYSHNETIELDENDLDVAASMMDALTIPPSEIGDDSKCYSYDDPLGDSGRHFESELDNYEASHSRMSEVIGDEDNDNGGDAPVMDLYAGNFSLKDASQHFAPDDFNNFTADWANFDNAFDVEPADSKDIFFEATNGIMAEEQDFPFASTI